MNTPLFDFVKRYREENFLRLHMPGHKGNASLGCEGLDITEIYGADTLYAEDGILAESQRNASRLFGTRKTLYSAEGSTLSIRGMLALVAQYARFCGEKPIIAAARNAHRSFLSGCALLDLNPIWLDSRENASALFDTVTPKDVEGFFHSVSEKITALYITSPNYLGQLSDIRGIAEICHRNRCLLLVDNAHGAYLHFLPESLHPIDQGADLCCDSAHKTLPVLTGGAYLHISKSAPNFFVDNAASAMSLFSSTSPSYLILESLDLCNSYLDSEYREKLLQGTERISVLKDELRRLGFVSIGNEPLKITLRCKDYGYQGDEIARILRTSRIECEFSDPDYVVMMISPECPPSSLDRILYAFCGIPRKDPITVFPPVISHGSLALSPRDAVFSPSESVPISLSAGRILAQPSLMCPPAIPIAVCGEILTTDSVKAMEYYGIHSVRCVLE